MELKNKKYPWKATLSSIRNRVKFQPGYRHVKCLITAEELKILWFRDKAYLMEKPSIDRKNNRGNYTFKNCQYLEMLDNCRKQNAIQSTRDRFSKRSKLNWKNPVFRKIQTKRIKKLWQNEDYRKRMSIQSTEQSHKLWKNKNYRNIMKRMLLKSKRDKFGRFKKRL